MPTTRTAVKTAGLSSGSEASVSPTKESQIDSRKAGFSSRKKREPPADPTPMQRIMIQFLNAIINVDTRYLLWTKPSEENSILFESIEDRVYKGKYKDLSSFKADFNELLLSVIPSARLSHDDTDAFKKLYIFTEKSLNFESKRLKENLKQLDSLFEQTALFRLTTDGYAFTDMTLKDPSKGPATNLPQNVQEMVIHPAPPAQKDQIPTLKSVVAPPPKYYTKTLKHEEKPVLPVHWLDFGAFSSFAPASDSNHANATYENTYMGRSAKRLRKSKQNDVPKAEDMETDDAELNAAWLAKEGLDMDVIEAATNRASDNVNEELERNSELLEELLSYQKTRFSGDQSKWTAVEEKEVEIAKTLEKNMTHMLSKLPPNATTDTKLIEKTMERLPVFEAAYRGTLPPHKIFSFPTTEKAENLPPYANITPTYSKENWRLVKVAPFPPKDGSMNHFPLVSMIEQQQLNFYTKPPFPPQAQQPLPPQPPQQQRVPIAGSPYTYQQQPPQRR